MKIKTYPGSKYSYLRLKIRVPQEWLEQLEILVEISGLKNMDHYVKTLLAWRLLTQQKAIKSQREKNIEEEKRMQEYWEYCKRGDADE